MTKAKADSAAAAPPDAPVVAPASMFSDCGDTPCPEPVLPAASPEQTAALTDGVRMRENPAEWAFVRLSKLIEDFEKGLDKDEEVGARIVGLPGDGAMVMGMAPVVGVPMPLLSYGGSSMMTVMIGFGLVMATRVHRYAELPKGHGLF